MFSLRSANARLGGRLAGSRSLAARQVPLAASFTSLVRASPRMASAPAASSAPLAGYSSTITSSPSSYGEVYTALGGPARTLTLALDAGDVSKAWSAYESLTSQKGGFRILMGEDFFSLVSLLVKAGTAPVSATEIDRGFPLLLTEYASKVITVYEDFYFSGASAPAEIYEAVLCAYYSVQHYTSVSNADDMYRVYHEMLDRKVLPTVKSYLALMALVARPEVNNEVAMQQLTLELRMQTDLYLPIPAYYSHMRLYKQLHEPLKVDEAFMEASLRYGAKNLHIDIWKCLLDTHMHQDAGLGARVDDIRQHMHNLGVKPDAEMTKMLDHYLHGGH